MVKIVAFDTETTGKLPVFPGRTWKDRDLVGKIFLDKNRMADASDLWSQFISEWPSIIQLSYVLYDTDNPVNATLFNNYIDIGEDVEISEESIQIHHITREIIANATNKMTIKDALNMFLKDARRADVIVAHNAQFDRLMIMSEILRLSDYDDKQSDIELIMEEQLFECTMEKTKPICNIIVPYNYTNPKTGEQKVFENVKAPKLIEAYKHYFGYEPTGEAMHDAIIDAIVCLRVYCMTLEPSLDICGTNRKITRYINSVTPPEYKCPTPSLSLHSTVKTKKRRIKRRNKKGIKVKNKTKRLSKHKKRHRNNKNK